MKSIVFLFFFFGIQSASFAIDKYEKLFRELELMSELAYTQCQVMVEGIKEYTEEEDVEFVKPAKEQYKLSKKILKKNKALFKYLQTFGERFESERENLRDYAEDGHKDSRHGLEYLIKAFSKKEGDFKKNLKEAEINYENAYVVFEAYFRLIREVHGNIE